MGLDNLRDASNYDGVYIEMGMYHGGQLLCLKQKTNTTAVSAYPRWNRWFIFNMTVRNIPKVVYGTSNYHYIVLYVCVCRQHGFV